MENQRRWLMVGLAGTLAVIGWALLPDGRDASAASVAGAGERGPPSGDAATRSVTEGHDVLFRVDPTPMPGSGPMADSVAVTVSRQAALGAGQTGHLTVALPDGTRYPVRYERSESAPGGDWTFFGRVDTPVGALAAVITFGTDGVFGVLPTPDGRMMKLATRGGQAYLQPAGWSVPPGVDPSQHPDYVMSPATGAPAMESSDAPAGAAAPISQAADEAGGEVTITVLAAYTANLSQLRGSATAAQTEYRNLVAVMNQAHVDSGSRARFEIAGFVELDYPAGAWNADALGDMIDNTLPGGTDLHALRDEKAADLVAMIRPYATGDLTCGISQFPGNELASNWLSGDTGFSVSAVESCAPLVFAHEIGHNLGLMHDRDTVAGPHGGTLSYGVFPFSFGYRQLGPPGFATVMAYDSESRPWVGFFSHPGTALCGGTACGDAALADNVRSINLIADSISRFRDPPGVISIGDRWEYEYDLGGSEWMTVSLSSPAPAGGVTFDVEMIPGTAGLGVDFELRPDEELAGRLIPEGHWYDQFEVLVLADDIAEATETVAFRLRNVQGDVVVLDDAATLSIIDYDGTVPVEGTLRFPPGVDARPDFVRIYYEEFKGGATLSDYYVIARAPAYDYSLDVPRGSLLRLNTRWSVDGLKMQDVTIENVDEPMRGIDLRLREQVVLSGRVETPEGSGVDGVRVILWNRLGNGNGYYANYPDYVPDYAVDVLQGVSMQLEVRDPPAPYVRQVVEVPPLAAAGTQDIQLRELPSLTIPHATVREGTAADGARTILLTASLSVPRSETGVSFDIQVAGTADGDDFRLPATHFSIPKDRTRVEVPIVILGDDRREADETVELRITNVQGAAWNPGPGSVRIATDDGRPGDGSCTGAPGAVRICQ